MSTHCDAMQEETVCPYSADAKEKPNANPKTSEKESSKAHSMFVAHRSAQRPRANLKELRESYAFYCQTVKVFPKKKTIIDVCASQGLVSLWFLAFRKARRSLCAINCDPCVKLTRLSAQAQRAVLLDLEVRPALGTIYAAWEDFLPDFAGAIETHNGDFRQTSIPIGLLFPPAISIPSFFS